MKWGSSAHLNQFTVILILALTLLAISNTSLTITRGDGVQSSVVDAYTKLADVYATGGEAPDLVAKLNAAINLTEQAKVKRGNGDLVGAGLLDKQAEDEIRSVLSEIPAAQQKAIRVSSIRTLTAIALVPILVIVSTFVFYLALRTLRTCERRRLYEMRIVEESKD